jgi:threonine dehydrogenase-like Zn-dependent dehydrogenase
MESHGVSPEHFYDRAKQALMLETDRPLALRQVIHACRKGGTVSIPGVYGGLIDKFPIGAAFLKGLTLRMGQTHVHKYMRLLLERIRRGDIDPSFVISHQVRLDDAPDAYRMFREKVDDCMKVVMKP